MDRPKKLKTTTHKGITHEALDEAYNKARTRIQRQPVQAGKAVEDSRNIAQYFEQRGIPLPDLKKEHPMMWRKI